ncbi:hypothetical protein [Sphingomonas flavalba]|uniref:hypothetical protein n=1 Tax=Sphingomonas flavalba TaxID=2559804 RepID=UPI00109DA4AF|nr:hypothetical protein [Sphingomonas flavalba]
MTDETSKQDAARPAPPVKKAATRKAPTAKPAAKRAAGAATRAAAKPRKAAAKATGKVRAEAARLTGEAGSKARSYANQGKDRATDALDNVARMMTDAAAQVDDRMGEQYGRYARTAADAIAGLAGNLRKKDVDELMDEARDMVRNSPAVAIGAAAAIGFVLARLIKAGGPDQSA